LSRLIGNLRDAIEEILLEAIRLERRARLAGDDEESFCEIDLILDRFDLRGNRRVENMEIRFAECDREDFGA